MRHWTLDLDAATSPGARQHPAGVRPDGDARGPRPGGSRRRRAGHRDRGDTGSELFLVTLTGPGSSADRGGVTARAFRESALAEQDATLAAVGAGAPVYRWTTALNGYAVRMTAAQARDLAGDPAVATVEPDSVRRLAAAAPGGAATAADYPRLGGAGVVIGLVDSGLWPDSPLFADVRGLGRSARDFRGRCATGAGWADDVCDDKIVGAHWFVDGFGADRVRSGARLSPLDDDGHGTLMASIAAGNAGVSVKVPGQRAGLYAGAAPAGPARRLQGVLDRPRPARRRLLLRRPGHGHRPSRRRPRRRAEPLRRRPHRPQAGVDTVERALLGAAEADVVVVAAAGNRGTRAYAAHASPWVTSVGGTTGATRRGAVVAPGLRLAGAMAARTAVRPGAPRARRPGRVGRRHRLPVALLPARQPRRRPRLRTHRGVRARPHRTRRQVRGRRAGRRRGHGARQHQPRPGHRRLPQRADRPPDQGRRPPPGQVDACTTPAAWCSCDPTACSAPPNGSSPGPARATRPVRSSSPTSSRRPSASSAPPRRPTSAVAGTSAPARRSPPPVPAASRPRCSAATTGRPPRCVRPSPPRPATSPATRPCCAWGPAAPGRAPPTGRVWCSGSPSATTAPGSTATSTRPRSTPRPSCSRAPGP